MKMIIHTLIIVAVVVLAFRFVPGVSSFASGS